MNPYSMKHVWSMHEACLLSLENLRNWILFNSLHGFMRWSRDVLNAFQRQLRNCEVNSAYFKKLLCYVVLRFVLKPNRPKLSNIGMFYLLYVCCDRENSLLWEMFTCKPWFVLPKDKDWTNFQTVPSSIRWNRAALAVTCPPVQQLPITSCYNIAHCDCATSAMRKCGNQRAKRAFSRGFGKSVRSQVLSVQVFFLATTDEYIWIHMRPHMRPHNIQHICNTYATLQCFAGERSHRKEITWGALARHLVEETEAVALAELAKLIKKELYAGHCWTQLRNPPLKQPHLTKWVGNSVGKPHLFNLFMQKNVKTFLV